MHEDTVEVAALHTSDLDRFVSPAHNLSRTDIRDAGRHLAPLKDHRLRDPTVRIYVYALVIVAEQQLHAVAVW